MIINIFLLFARTYSSHTSIVFIVSPHFFSVNLIDIDSLFLTHNRPLSPKQEDDAKLHTHRKSPGNSTLLSYLLTFKTSASP